MNDASKPDPSGAASKPYLPELDLIRAILIAAVVTIHATSFMTSNADESSAWYALYKTLSVISSFAVPAFIFLSGFVMIYSYLDKPMTRRTMATFYRKRALTIVLPYVLFSLIYLVYHNYDNPNVFSSANVSKMTEKLLTGGAHTHLYYIFVIMQYYLLFPLILYAMKKSKSSLAAFLAGVALQWGYYFLNREVIAHAAGLPDLLHKTGSLFVSYIGYYMFGAFLAANIGRFRTFVSSARAHLAAWIVIAIGWLVSGAYYAYIQYTGSTRAEWADSRVFASTWFVYILLSCLLLFLVADVAFRKLPAKARDVAANLGKCSFGVFFIHPLILAEFRKLPIGGDTISFNLFYLGEFASALLVSWAISYFFMRLFGWSWVLFGATLRPSGRRTPVEAGKSLNA